MCPQSTVTKVLKKNRISYFDISSKFTITEHSNGTYLTLTVFKLYRKGVSFDALSLKAALQCDAIANFKYFWSSRHR